MADHRVHHFPCQHEGGTGEHHPLTPEEVRALLETAAASDDWRERNNIQIRLTQGVRGITCPHPAEGDVARRMSAVGRLYVETVEADPALLPSLAARFFELLNGAEARRAE